MTVPLGLLAIGALAAGFAFSAYFIGHEYEHFWRESLFLAEGNEILVEMHQVPGLVVWSPTIMMVAGFLLSWLFYIVRPDIPGKLASTHVLLYKFLLNKWYFDELYDFIFVRPAKALGRLFWKGGDGAVIDGAIDGTAASVGWATGKIIRLQTGYVYHYAFAMLIGVALIVTWFAWPAGIAK